MENIVLDVKNLTKKFGPPAGGFTAVDNISLELKEREVLGLLGPNGAGKTTTIQMLLGVMEPTDGKIIYFGKSFSSHSSEILKQINFSSTYISLPWHFTVSEILDIFAMLYEVPQRQKRITKLLIEFELDHMRKKQFFMLSAGEKTRLLLVKSFLNYPRVLLLDEPTASLDPEIAVKIRNFLKKEKQEYNVSMLFTSHNMAEVEEMCDRVIIIQHGKVVIEDTPENLTKQIATCELELKIIKDNKKALAFIKEKEIPFSHERYNFTIIIDERNIADFLMLLASEKIDYEEIAINKPDLEDVFLDIIRKGKDHERL